MGKSSGKVIQVRPYNTKELSALYGVSYKTFKKWLRPHKEQIGDKIGYYYNIDQVKTIFRILSLPFEFTFEDGLDN